MENHEVIDNNGSNIWQNRIFVYNIKNNIFTWYSQEMGKFNNIVIWITATASTLGILGKNDVFAQTNQLPKQKSEIPARINKTQEQIAQIDGYDYQKMLYMDISLLSPDMVKRVMFDRINEIRKEHKLKPLTYDVRLETLAYDFWKEKNGTKRWDDPNCHTDKNGTGFYWRVKKAGLLPVIKTVSIDNRGKGIEENMVTAKWSVYYIVDILMNSEKHQKTILSPYINSVGIWNDTWRNVLVQDFVYFTDR